jgi:hypothetical protein
MAKAPSIETQLKTARAELRKLHIDLLREQQQVAHYRARTMKAEQEVAEWKQRFDILLRRDQEQSNNG